MMADKSESLATDCIGVFGTANIHNILKLHCSSGTDKLKQAAADYLEGNAESVGASIIERFANLFKEPELFLEYILHNKVRPYYFLLDESPVLQTADTINQLKQESSSLNHSLASCQSELATLKADHASLKEQFKSVDNELKVKIGEVLHKQSTIDLLENKISKHKLELSRKGELEKEISVVVDKVKKDVSQRDIQTKFQQETINYQRNKIEKLKSEVRHKDSKLRRANETSKCDSIRIQHLIDELKSERVAHDNTKKIIEIKNRELNQRDEENERLRHYSKELNRALDRYKPVYHQPA